jgi:hypothetical protein
VLISWFWWPGSARSGVVLVHVTRPDPRNCAARLTRRCRHGLGRPVPGSTDLAAGGGIEFAGPAPADRRHGAILLTETRAGWSNIVLAKVTSAPFDGTSG